MLERPAVQRAVSTLAPDPPEKADLHNGHRKRLRARFLGGGEGALADYELLELILFAANARHDMKPLAKRLLTKFGSFAEVIAAPRERLAELSGVGESVIAQLKIVEAAAHRFARGQVKGRDVLSSWSGVLDYCRTAMAFGEREELRILFLDKATGLLRKSGSRWGRSITHRSTRARWSGAHSSFRRLQLSWCTITPRAIPRPRVPTSR
jgi:DNA repair protein RadC